MSLEDLEKKLSELLSISETEKSSAFSIFKSELGNFLNFGEAVKIDGLGIFQKKEQVLNNDLFNLSKKVGLVPTILFTPENKLSSSDALFINLDLPQQTDNIFEFNEEVFNLGIGKKLIPLKKDTEVVLDIEKSIKSKIENLISNATKIQDYDLWEDYLQIKETKNTLGEDNNVDFDKFLDEEIFYDEHEKITPEDFIEIDENISDEIPEIHENIKSDLSNDNADNDSNKNNELIPLVDPWKETPDIIEDEISEDIKKDFKNNSPDTDIYTEIKNLKFKDDELSTFEDEIIKNGFDDELSKTKDETKTIDETELADLGNEISSLEIDVNQDLLKSKSLENYNKRKKNKLNFVSILLIVSFILLGFIIIYIYTLLNQNESIVTKVKPQIESFQKTSIDKSSSNEEQIIEELNNAVNTEANIDESEKSEMGVSDINNNKKNENVISENVANETNSVSFRNRNKAEESEVSKNIFFDGKQYSLQVSSWKQKSVAESEVNKLINKGYNAYINKMYIEEFKDTWNRVRIGPFNTLGEAKAAQLKLNTK